MGARPLGFRLGDALVCAARVHAGHVGKGMGIPNMRHLLAVAAYLVPFRALAAEIYDTLLDLFQGTGGAPPDRDRRSPRPGGPGGCLPASARIARSSFLSWPSRRRSASEPSAGRSSSRGSIWAR